VRALVTGATGKVGHAIAAALLARGDEVRALVRDPARAAGSLPAGAEVVRGDVTEPRSLGPAVEGCELVFNAMGLPEQWVKDEGILERVNAVGSRDLARASREAGVPRFVHTSTHDVFHADQGQPFDETMLADYPKGTAYERSKQHAEELVLAEGDGMEIVLLNPSGVYGPGPSASVSFDKGMFEPLVKKRLPSLPPGGSGLAFTEGVAAGHLLAAEKGKDGERYILADTYATFRELA
jgi:nucleoside-diphosphate-sugar epimerase